MSPFTAALVAGLVALGANAAAAAGLGDKCAASCTSGVLAFDPKLHCTNDGCGGCKGCAELQKLCMTMKCSTGQCQFGKCVAATAICTKELRLCKDGSQMPRAKDCTWLPEKCPASPCADKRCGEMCTVPCASGDMCLTVMGNCQADGGKCGLEKPTCAAPTKFSCLTKDLESNWADDKKKFCCEANGRGCDRRQPTANGRCSQPGAKWEGKGMHCGEEVTTGTCECTADKQWLCAAFRRKRGMAPCACDGKKCGEKCSNNNGDAVGHTAVEVCQADGGKCGSAEPKCAAPPKTTPCASKKCGERCSTCTSAICPSVVETCQADGGKCGSAEPKCDAFNCNTRDLESSWEKDKKKFCCEANGRGCAATPKPNSCASKKCGEKCSTCTGAICPAVVETCQADGKCGASQPKCPEPKPDRCAAVRCAKGSQDKCCVAQARLAERGEQLAVAEAALSGSKCANATASATCASLSAKLESAKAEYKAAAAAATAEEVVGPKAVGPGGNSTANVTAQPKAKATPSSTTAAATLTLKELKELADKAYAAAGCVDDPTKANCADLKKAQELANAALEDAESSATALAPVSALVAAALGFTAVGLF